MTDVAEPTWQQQAETTWEPHCEDIVVQLAAAASLEERSVIMAVFVALGGEEEFLTAYGIDPVTYEPMAPAPDAAGPCRDRP